MTWEGKIGEWIRLDRMPFTTGVSALLDGCLFPLEPELGMTVG